MSQRSSGHHYRANSGRVVQTHAAANAASSAASHPAHHPQRPAAQARPPVQPPSSPAKAPRPSSRKTDYTLGHSGRQVRVGPVTFWIAVGSLVIMAGWSLATGTYFAFHDDVLTRLITRQKEQQFAYEDRIAELRAQVDRITSRQLLNQEQFEQKLEQIMRRQSVLENRATTLSSVPDPDADRLDRPKPARPARRTAIRRPGQSLADQRHGDLHRAARSRGASGIPRTAAGRAQAPCRGFAQTRGRRRRHAGAAADFARPRRGAADHRAQRDGGALRLQGQAHPRRARRSRHGRQEARSTATAARGRRPLRSAHLAQGRRRSSSASSTACTSRAPTSTG